MNTLQQPRVPTMLQKIFTGTEQEYERYKRKRRYTPKTITVIERIPEEGLTVDKQDRKEAVQLMHKMQAQAKKNGVTEENLEGVISDILDDE